jgi:hypothetical protein
MIVAPSATSAATGLPVAGASQRITIEQTRLTVTTEVAPGCPGRVTVALRPSRLPGPVIIHVRIRDVQLLPGSGSIPLATVQTLPAVRTVPAPAARALRVLRVRVQAVESVHRDGRREGHDVTRTARIRLPAC